MSAPAGAPPPASTTPTPPAASPPSPVIATPPVPQILAPPPVPLVSPPPPVLQQSPPPPTPVQSPPAPVPVQPPPSPSPSPPPPVQSPPPPVIAPVPPSPSPPPPAVVTPPPTSNPPPSSSPPPPDSSPPPPDNPSPSPPADGSAPPPSRAPPPLRRLGPPPPAGVIFSSPPPPSSPPGVPSPPPLPPASSPPGVPSPPPLGGAAGAPPPSNVVTPPSPTNNTALDPGKSTPGPPSPAGGALTPPGVPIVESSKSGGSISGSTIVGIAIGGVLILALLALVLLCFTRKKKKRPGYGATQDFRAATSIYSKDGTEFYYDPGRGRFDSGYSSASDANGKPLYPPPSLGHAPTRGSQGGGGSNSNFTYEELAQATNGFSKVNMLGEGGFGCVYKGILPGGQEVAVKQLKVGGGQGEREFRAEVEIITRIHHRHLVTLVGYCIAQTQRLLVYEFVPNGTLEHHLHGKGRALLDWNLRVKIAIGSARGLGYLHEDCHPKIIHRDIKSSNILLDSNFEAQVADFGLAKLASDTHTHVTTRVMGTFGYLAPEYASSGKLTDKSDIYSFGVVLLELITGRKPVDTSQPLGEESLVEWSRPLLSQALENHNMDVLADPLLNGEYDKDEMLRMVQSAAACIRHSANKRPRMSQVVRALENDLRSGFSGIHDSPFGSEDYDSVQYSSDLRRFKKMALGGASQEYGSEYSGATSEYGVNPSVSSGELQSREWTARNGGAARESERPLRSGQM